MSIQSVSQPLNANTVNSVNTANNADNKPIVDLSAPEDKIELSSKQEVKKESSTAKKIGTGIASFICPGLGQLVNGQGGKAAKFFFGTVGVDILTGVGVGAIYLLNPPVALGISAIGALAHIGVAFTSVYDAVKNA